MECRLCANTSTFQFKLKVLGRHDVRYFKCEFCGSLQTEDPYWINEAYGDSNLSSLDTGAAQRNLSNLAASYVIAKLFRVRDVIDVGGGDGLLTRLLRDYGINCYSKDKYAIPTYSLGFTEENFDIPEMILGFEVLEHLMFPRRDLGLFFERNPKLVLLSTGIFRDQDKDWWYLSPESGQHVFFYSRKALEIIAQKYEYSLVVSGGYILYVKGLTSKKYILARLALKNKILRLVKALMMLIPTPNVWTDYLSLDKGKNNVR